jgi:hypothetical protein
MDADFHKVQQVLGEPVVDPEGQVIGKIVQVAYEPTTFRAEWLVLKTSRFGRQPRLVPVEAVRYEGRTIWIPYSKETVLAAPVPAVPLSPASSEVTALLDHYRNAA